MNLMDMLSQGAPGSIIEDNENGFETILDNGNSINENDDFQNDSISDNDYKGIYYLPSTLSEIQKELGELMINVFSPQLLEEVNNKARITRIDSLLKSEDDNERSIRSYDCINLLFDQSSLLNKHPSLLVDHFTPKRLLLSETKERLVRMSGKFDLFNRLIDTLIYTVERPLHLLVVADSVKELELVEALLIGKELYYYNFSHQKLYDDGRSIPDSKSDEAQFKLYLHLTTSSLLYNNFTNSSTLDQKKIGVIFSFDTYIDVENPGVDLLRSNGYKTPILIPIPVYSMEHIATQIPKPKITFNIHKDTSSPLFKWRMEVLNALVINRHNWFESGDNDRFFLDYYGNKMSSLKDWILSFTTKKFPLDNLREFNNNLALQSSAERLQKKLQTRYLKQDFDFHIHSFDYKTFREKLAILLNERASYVQKSTTEKNNRLITIREDKTSIQLGYDAMEDTISDNYRKLRKLNDTITPAEKRVQRLDSDLNAFTEKKRVLDGKLEFLRQHIANHDLTKLIEDQQQRKELLKTEVETLDTEYTKLSNEVESLRGEYQSKSTEAVQKTAQLEVSRATDLDFSQQLNGLGLTLLPPLVKKDETINYEATTQKLKRENSFISRLFAKNLDKFVKERHSILDGTGSGLSGSSSSRSRATTPY